MDAGRKISFYKLKHFVFIFFLLLFFMPMIQQQFNIVKEKKLEGVENEAAVPIFATDVFLEGKFQKEFEEALDINIGFRKTLVRINNQIQYSVFNTTKAGDFVVGKNKCLLGKSYIFGYSGEDFTGKNVVDLQIEKAKVIEKELAKKNISLLFAFAPGKASYYPEYIPVEYLRNYIVDSTNYTYYTKACFRADLNVIDLRNYFLSIKEKAHYPIFPKVGLHWGEYAAVLSIGAIVNKIEDLNKIKMRNFNISSVEYRDTIKQADRDAERMMNLFYDLPTNKMAYIKLRFSCDSLSVKPNLLVIADSYFSTIVATGAVDSLFSNWDYWLYNDYESKNRSKTEYNFKNDIEERDVVLLMATDATLASFPYRFIDEAYEVYAPKNKSYYELKNREFRQFITTGFKNIEKDKKWKRQLNKNAKENNVSEIDEYFAALVWLYGEQEVKIKRFVKK